MIDAIFSALGLTGPGPLIALILGSAAAILVSWLRGRKSQRQDSTSQTVARVRKGQRAVQQGRKQGTPDERVRANDGAWE